MAFNPGPGELHGMLVFVVSQLLIKLEQLITQLTHRIPESQQGADFKFKKIKKFKKSADPVALH